MTSDSFRYASSTFIRWAGALAICFCFLTAALAQDPAKPTDAKAARKLGVGILEQIRLAIKDNYYDPKFRGINIDERCKVAEQKVKTLETYAQVYRVIAQVVLEFKDSHTRFVPPPLTKTVDYGLEWQMIGDKCYIVGLTKGSDAEAKGLKVGDEITGIGDYNPTRENLWLLTYLFHDLDPKERLKIFVAAPGGEREVLIESKIVKTSDLAKAAKARDPYRCEEMNPSLVVCKLYSFDVENDVIDSMMKTVRRHEKLILDLRGNPGGRVTAEEHLIGFFFAHDVKVADEKTRLKTESRIAKTHKDKAFAGDLIVLIDSESTSAAEVFARVIQLEKRGKVLGDVSGGKVMTSKFFPLLADFDFYQSTVFGLNLTVSDLIMTDGKSLENVGVIPDKAIGPSASDLADRTDPILAYAAAMFGVQFTPEEAGRLHFINYGNSRP
jgi:C-terminal processing protease CtpA/Prc